MPKLLEVRTVVCTLHYSLRTEQTYIHWIKQYIFFNSKRHPSELGATDVSAFLSYLALDRKVAASTQNQALAAILFLYRHVLKHELPWLEDAVRAKRPKRIPLVFTREEVSAVLSHLSRTTWLNSKESRDDRCNRYQRMTGISAFYRTGRGSDRFSTGAAIE